MLLPSIVFVSISRTLGAPDGLPIYFSARHVSCPALPSHLTRVASHELGGANSARTSRRTEHHPLGGQDGVGVVLRNVGLVGHASAAWMVRCLLVPVHAVPLRRQRHFCRCCCDAWQHWKWWQEEQYSVASASLRDQFLLLSSHPSVLAFMLSSDELPPPDVEAMYYRCIVFLSCFGLYDLFERYNNVTRDTGWLDHAQTLSAAAAANSSLSGPSGVKMSGPYSWVLHTLVHRTAANAIDLHRMQHALLTPTPGAALLLHPG